MCAVKNVKSDQVNPNPKFSGDSVTEPYACSYQNIGG